MLIHVPDPATGLLLPRSDATDAFHLCLDGAQVIRMEPRAYHQSVWLAEAPFDHLPPTADEYPPCGTISCRGGWLVLLTGLVNRTRGISRLQTQAAVVETALRLLGAEWEYLDTTGSFPSAFDAEVDALFNPLAVVRYGQTQADYAEQGARGLEEFAERWKARLLATPVPWVDDDPADVPVADAVVTG
jgi:hypothetical protein